MCACCELCFFWRVCCTIPCEWKKGKRDAAIARARRATAAGANKKKEASSDERHKASKANKARRCKTNLSSLLFSLAIFSSCSCCLLASRSLLKYDFTCARAQKATTGGKYQGTPGPGFRLPPIIGGTAETFFSSRFLVSSLSLLNVSLLCVSSCIVVVGAFFFPSWSPSSTGRFWRLVGDCYVQTTNLPPYQSLTGHLF